MKWLKPTYSVGFFVPIIYLYYKVEYTITILLLVIFIAIYRLFRPKKQPKITKKSKKPTIWYPIKK